MASKTVTMAGVILDQRITKKSKHGAKVENVRMTAHEIAQLLHSYIDSSFLHEDQNLSKLIILMPSRVDTNFEYRNSTHENAETTELPLIPFTWANRNYDIPQTSTGFKLSFGATDFPDEILKSVTVTDDDDNDVTTTETEIPGITGYLNNFDCSFNGQETPAVTFNLSFTSASTAISDFINSAF